MFKTKRYDERHRGECIAEGCTAAKTERNAFCETHSAELSAAIEKLKGEQMSDDEKRQFKPGLWKHYKGGTYYALGLVTHHDTRKPMVVYANAENGIVTVRPLRGWGLKFDDSFTGQPIDDDGWLDEVDASGGPMCTVEMVPRFVFVRPMTPYEFGRVMESVLKIFIGAQNPNAT